jgi:hypothetical protein
VVGWGSRRPTFISRARVHSLADTSILVVTVTVAILMVTTECINNRKLVEQMKYKNLI